MRQLPSDKYNVAWFKLAEFVARGERERALGIYKLLIHSFDDRALAAQLEGDIHLSFDDTAVASQKYIIAAQLYEAGNRYIEAAALYEHLVILNPIEISFYLKLIQLYELLEHPRLGIQLENLAFIYLGNQDFANVELLLDTWMEKQFVSVIQNLLTRIFMHIITLECPKVVIESLLHKILVYGFKDNETYLPKFLSILEQSSTYYHVKATEYLKTMSIKE